MSNAKNDQRSLSLFGDKIFSQRKHMNEIKHVSPKNITMFCDHAMNFIRIRTNCEVSFSQYTNLDLKNILNQSLHSIIEKRNEEF